LGVIFVTGNQKIIIMSEAQAYILSSEDFAQRQESGLLVPMDAGQGLQIVDCGDDRTITEAAAHIRREKYGQDIAPGRFFGGDSGLTLAALLALTAQTGEQAIASFVKDYSAEAFVDFGADISDRAYRQEGIHLNQHSANKNEGNDLTIAADHLSRETQLGCAFATFCGKILEQAGTEFTLVESKGVRSLAGISTPLESISEAAQILGGYLGPDFGVHRGALHHAITKSPNHTPVTIHDGDHIVDDSNALVIDFSGYRSDAGRNLKAGRPRYHHTPGIASDYLPDLLQEYRLNPALLTAASLLLANATRAVLPGNLNIEIIPAEYCAA
jgi:hypothetical protein